MFSKNKTARIGIVCFVVFCLCMLLAGSAVAKKPVKPEPPPPPQETEGGILSLDGINIVTVQPWEDGSLHVWSDNSVSPVWSNIVPDSSWTLLDVYHRAVAIGDLDGNGLKEILVHAACSYNGDSVTFINAYEGEDKQVDPLQIRDYIDGIQDPWWTTYYSPDDFVEQGTSIRDQIIAADLDKNGDDEIVLITSEYISIFDF